MSKKKLKEKLIKNKSFSSKEIQHLKKIYPNFKDDCKLCRFNLCLHLGLFD